MESVFTDLAFVWCNTQENLNKKKKERRRSLGVTRSKSEAPAVVANLMDYLLSSDDILKAPVSSVK